MAQGARDRGIRAVSAVLPYFYPLDETAIFNHLKSIAESVPELAFYVYNIPQHGEQFHPRRSLEGWLMRLRTL